MLNYFISLALVCFMLFALPKEAFLGNYIGIIAMLLIFSAIYLLFVARKGREFIQKSFANPFFISLLSILFINAFFIGAKGTFSVSFFGISVFVFLIPTLIIYFAKPGENKFHPLDMIVLFMIYMIIFMKTLNIPLLSQTSPLSLDGGYNVLLLYLILTFTGVRKIKLNFEYQLSLRMILFTLLFTAILLAIDVFCGIKTNFVKFSGWDSNIKDAGILTVFMVFFVALFEEIFYRGLIYNFLAQYLEKCSIYVPLILSAIIFGIAHLANFGVAMALLATIAGFFYGLVYIKTQNIFCAVLVHSLTNLCWRLFFITNT